MQCGSMKEFVKLKIVTVYFLVKAFDAKDTEEVSLLMQEILVEAGIIGGGQQEGADAQAATSRPRDKAITNNDRDAELKNVPQIINLGISVLGSNRRRHVLPFLQEKFQGIFAG